MNIENILKAVEAEVLNDHFIKWNGDNLAEVIAFTGVSERFHDWFMSWQDYENYVTMHGNIFKIFDLTGHYEVPVGSWIAKTPDGQNLPMGPGVRYVPENDSTIHVDHLDLDDIDENVEHEIPITREEPVTFYYPEDPYETEVVDDGHSFSLRHKLDKDGKPIFKKSFNYPHGWHKALTELDKFATKK